MELERVHFDQLIIAAVEAREPSVAARCRKQYAAAGRGVHSVPLRRLLLDVLLEEKGPKGILQLANYVPLNLPASSLLFFLLTSSDPISIIDKLSRYDAYFDQEFYRLELREEGANYLVVENVVSNKFQSVSEDLFVFSFLTFLFERIGCRKLDAKWESVPEGKLKERLRQLGLVAESSGSCLRFRFQWESAERPGHIEGLDSFFLHNLTIAPDWSEKSLLRAVENQVESSLVNSPKIGDIAEKLGMSVRTLQRGLSREGTTYAQLINKIRIRAAERLMQNNNLTTTEIAHLSGFSDSGHFTRAFKKAVGLTPKHYRKVKSNDLLLRETLSHKAGRHKGRAVWNRARLT